MIIRLANYKDLDSINEIYNQSIPSKISTADLSPVSIDKRIEWFNNHDNSKYPVFVGVLNDMIIGWISLSPYRPGRMALRHTSEVSYYIHKDFQKKGIATQLMDFIIKNAPEYEIKNLLAILLETNKGSIRLLKNFNFRQWGYLPNVADFDGQECSQLYYGLRIDK